MKKFTAVALVIVMMLTLAVCTFAKDPIISPEKPGTEYKLTVIATEGGEAWYVKNPDGSYTVYAKPDKDHSFTKWTTEGDFEIVDGKIGDTPRHSAITGLVNIK